ncbi:MAG: hypothetical protein H0X45_08885 [Planctomycetes bacterium]|nr:hypothetical protein [Planctomycetota bacterium]
MRCSRTATVLAWTLGGAAGAAEPYIVIEQQWVRPSGAEPAYTRVDDDRDGTIEGDKRSLSWSYERATSVHIGLAIDATDRIEVAASLFDSSADDRVQAPQAGALWDILYFPGNADGEISGALNAQAAATSTIRAWTIDALWVHRLAESGPWRCDVAAGLRRTGMRNNFSVRYTYGAAAYRAEHLSDAVGTGIVGGVRVRRGWFEGRLGIHAEFSYAVLRGTLLGESLHYVETNYVDIAEYGSADATFTQWDAAVGLDSELGAGFTAMASYRIGQWGGMVSEDRFGTTLGEVETTTRDVAWDGFVAAIGWSRSF